MSSYDRWRTGNWGQDQFKGEKLCAECGYEFYPDDPTETVCSFCLIRTCSCGEDWKAIEDPESATWGDPDDIPDECPVCRCAARFEAVEDRYK